MSSPPPTTTKEKRRVAKPSATQLAWHDRQVGAIIHWNLQTLCMERISVPEHTYLRCQAYGWIPPEQTVREWDPVAANASEWVSVARSFGARYVILVVDHFSGFALWPTAVHNYSLNGATAWSGAGGDLVRDFLRACRDQDVTPGFFYSVHENWHERVHDFHASNPKAQEAYNELSGKQLEELLTWYGDEGFQWGEIWFDAGVNSTVNPVPGQVVRRLAPLAACHSCRGFTQDPVHPDRGYGIRWMGNENGVMPLPSWGASTECGTAPPWNGDPRADKYCPPSVDTVLHDHYWFWEPDWRGWRRKRQRRRWRRLSTTNHTQGTIPSRPSRGTTMKSTAALVSNYLTSVGRASNLVLDIAPDTTGAIPPADVAAYRAMGEAIDCLFSCELARNDGSSSSLSLAPPSMTIAVRMQTYYPVHNLSVYVREDISDGQLINAWSMVARCGDGPWDGAADDVDDDDNSSNSSSSSSSWIKVETGTGIGSQRILPLPLPSPCRDVEVQLKALSHFAVPGQRPRWRDLFVYDWSDMWDACIPCRRGTAPAATTRNMSAPHCLTGTHLAAQAPLLV